MKKVWKSVDEINENSGKIDTKASKILKKIFKEMEQNCENFPPCIQRREKNVSLDRIAEQEKKTGNFLWTT